MIPPQMSATDTMELLTSQRQFIQRLQHAGSFESQLILAAGDAGTGKTTLAHEFLTQSDSTLRQALVSVGERVTEAACRHQILTQLVEEPLFDESDALCESLLRMLPEQASELLVVIDDAHRLPAQIWQELAETVVMLRQQAQQHRLVVVLFAEPALIPAKVAEEWGRQAWFIDMNVPSLTQEEQILLLDRFVGALPAVWNEEAILARLEALPPNITAVINFSQEITEGNEPVKQAFPWHRITLPAALIIALLCGYLGYQIWAEIDLADISLQVEAADPAEQTIEPVILDGQDVDTAMSEEEAATALPVPLEDQLALPKQIDTPPVVTETPERTGKEVILTDDLLAKLESNTAGQQPVDDKLTQELFAELDPVAAKSSQQPLDANDPVVPESAQPEQVATEASQGEQSVVSPSATSTAGVATGAITKTDTEVAKPSTHSLLDVADSAFTLQVAVMQSADGVDKVLKANGLEGRKDIHRYILQRNGKRLHVAVLGIFNDKQSARAEIRQLPEAAQKLGLWPKSFAVIKPEVRSGLEQ